MIARKGARPVPGPTQMSGRSGAGGRNGSEPGAGRRIQHGTNDEDDSRLARKLEHTPFRFRLNGVVISSTAMSI